MPNIKLKPGSPEYADDTESFVHEGCDMPDCKEKAPYKAPKHRGLDEYYHFCLDHAREYNKAWNFFDGMADCEVQKHMHNSWYGDRPTWQYGVDGQSPEDILRQKIHETYYYGSRDNHNRESTMGGGSSHPIHQNTPEFEALTLMGLRPPVDLSDIRARYKELAKQHHPDLNNGCQKSEELLKQINMAYTILKVAYENFEKLPD